MGLATSDWLFLIAIVVLVILFMGPGLWSNHTDLPIVLLWRRWRNKGSSKPKPPPPDDDEFS